MSWAPLFSKIVDSSIWQEPDDVVKIFLTMLAKKESDHVVRGNAYMIGKWAKKEEQEVIDALKVLSSPDTKRIEKQPYDGRRIERVDDGWLILNGQHYEDEMRKISRRVYKTKKAREYRDKGRLIRNGKPLPGETLVQRAADRADGSEDAAMETVEREMLENREGMPCFPD